MARYRPNDPRDMMAAMDFLNTAREHNKEIELKWYRPKRTNLQNNYLYFCLQWFAHEYNCTLVEAKEVFLKRIAAPHIFEREIVVNGETIKYYRSTADLDTVEMMSAIENFRAFAETNGVSMPDKEEDHIIRYCEREIEKTQGYGT